ncbi:MAG: DUF423 domain-containing protein [Gammaproteobacteria bacterium]
MKIFLLLGSVSALLAVVFDAFAAHALKKTLAADMLVIFQTGARYQFYHALGLLAVGLSAKNLGDSPYWHWAGWSMCAGIVLFSGSLYVLALTGVRGVGAITPLGGLAFIAGWAMFTVAVWKAL